MPHASRSVGRAAGTGVVLLALALVAAPVSAAFARRKVITVDRARVPGTANHVDFPVLVSIAGDANLRTTANGGSVTSALGHDILFRGEDAATCAPAASPCRLDHEIESYDGSTGTLVAWVRVPTLQYSGAAASTIIYLYYGDATVACSQQNRTGVWDAGYREVFHLHEPGDHADSTKNAFAAVGKGAVTNGAAGQIGPAVDFAGGVAGTTPARIVVSDGKLPTTASFTFEAWVYFRSFVAGGNVGFVSKGRECLNFDGSPVPQPTLCSAEPCGDWVALYKAGSDKFSFGWAPGGGLLGCKVGNMDDPGAVVNTGQWYHVAGSFDVATKTRRLLVNGAEVVTDTGSACLEADIPHYGLMGIDDLQDDYLDGVLDEVRVSFAARSNDWIATGYNSQSAPGTFYESVVDEAGLFAVAATACPSRNPCAGGPGTCYLRSIGDTAVHSTGSGTCTATFGSSVVTCPSATWRTDNRGRGDRITIEGTHYMVLAVDSETQLRLSTPFAGTGGVGNVSYAMSRQFGTLQAWEDCISTGGPACPYFPVVNGDLVSGNRSEVGIVYKDVTYVPQFDATLGETVIVWFQDSTTDAAHTITLTADGINRHYGVSGAGVILDNSAATNRGIVNQDQFVTVEWLEVRGDGSSAGGHCIDYIPTAGANPNRAVIRDNIVRNCGGQSVRIEGSATGVVADISNNIIYRGSREGVRINLPLGTGTGSLVRILNNTFLRNGSTLGTPWTEIGTAETPNPYVVLRNNILVDDAQAPDVTWNGLALCTNAANCDWWNAASGNNITGDAAPPTGQWQSDIGPNPRGGGLASATETGLRFVNSAAGSENLHLTPGSTAFDRGADLTGPVNGDIDAQIRSAPWDVGADELFGTTAVKLMSFAATAADSSVALEWRTGSELDNLGFHLYRGPSADGPWTRLTSSLIPGLGSSPLGQAYSWLDTGLTNGTRHYYRLEDVDTASKSTFHGPVSAVPVPASSPPREDGEGGGGGDDAERGRPGISSCPSWVLAAAPDVPSPRCTRHGDPDSVSLQVLAHDSSSATLELHTGGFWALRDAAGEVRVFVPGLEFPSEPRAPALPLRRALVEAVVGKGVELVSAEAFELRTFLGLSPAAVGAAEVAVRRDGTVRPARRSLAAPLASRGYQPREVARLAGTAFQGERKSAVVEITPVRFSRSGLVLAGRVRVRLAFTGVVEGESGTGSRGRALPVRRAQVRYVLARLHTSRRGLHAVAFEQLFPQRGRGFSTSLLRLQRQGEAVAFHVEPRGPLFGPGSVLYFYADCTASSMEYSSEVAYELVRSSGVRMAMTSAPPLGALIGTSSTGSSSFETNRIYQPGLLEAKDLWLWDYMPSGASRTKGFALSGADTASGEAARLAVSLQGGSESGQAVDHHVELSVNGARVGETMFAGKRPHLLEVSLPASLLREGANELSVTNVGDTGVSSGVFLDRFEITYPQASTATSGVFEGAWAQTGTVEVAGLSGVPAILSDAGLPGPATVKWLTGFQRTGSSVRFQVEAGHRYLVVTPEGLLSPRVGRIRASTLRDRTNQADYLVIAPREFLEAATPLLERRRNQGLVSRAVPFEEIASEFGHAQPSAEAIRSFLSYAWHSWRRPSPRYVLLLGDATDDPQRFVSTSWASPLPALRARTSYLWTASDPALGAVNGEDRLPDLSIGRLPATTLEQVEDLVSKLLAWEESGQGLSGNAVLVADKPDAGGDFEADVEDVRSSFLSGRATTTLRVGELGGATRGAILGAFDEGASLMSYVGHGGTTVWSSANVLSTWDAPALRAQSRQPVLLTLNCLNGYFVAPNLDALPEAFLKAEGRGVVAAFSPSGLSLDGPAHQYHRAVMDELTSGRHERLGDAVLAAQRTYADGGLMPELLAIYQLLGDPALRIR